MVDWKTVTLGDICTRVCSGGTPKSNVEEYYNGDIPWLNTGEVDFNRIYETERSISQLGFDNSSAKWVEPDTIVVAMYGATAGKIGIIKRRMTTNQACCNLTINPLLADYNYVYYFLKTKYDYLLSLANGGAQQNLNAGIIKQLEIPLPVLETQKRIAQILSSLDDKIEVNNQINRNLKEQMQAIYKEFADNSKNKVPLHDLCSYANEKILVSNLNANNYFSTENILPNKAGAVDASALPTCSMTTKVQPGDILVSNIRPYFKKILFCVTHGGCSPDVLCFRPHNPSYSSYLYCSLYSDTFFDYMMSGAKGTKMPRGDKNHIMSYLISMPDKPDIIIFNSIVVPIMQECIQNRKENNMLSNLLDTLLPIVFEKESIEKIIGF